MVRIDDGSGKGFAAKVTSLLQLLTKAISREELVDQAIKGFGFGIGSGQQTLTNGVANAILFVKNNEDLDLVLERLVLNIGNSTAGLPTEDFLLELLVNPTAGTLISGGVDGAGINKNLGSSRTLDADIKVSNALAQTLSGESVVVPIEIADSGRIEVRLQSVIPKGSAIGIIFTPKESNTSVIITMALDTYLAALEA